MGRGCPKVVEALPKFAEELRALLAASEKPDLADQVEDLELLSRCGCGDSFCATFNTSRGECRRTLDLDSSEGMVIVDLDAADRILSVEVLYREDVERALSAALGGRR